MCHTTDSLSPRDRLAEKIRQRTNDGDDILDYLFDVFYDREPGVLHGHRIQAGRVLVIYGQVSPEAVERLRKLESHSGPGADRDQQKADSGIARKIRRMTGDGDDIIEFLLDTMNGIDSSGRKRIRHNNRLAAARELLKRGYPCECERHDDETGSPDTSVRAGTHSPDTQEENGAEQTDQDAADQEEQERLQRVVDKIRKIAEEEDASESKEEESTGRRIDYSMWETIRKQPRPEISEEHARIGAALFREAVAKQRLWRESGMKIPTRKDLNGYDDG